MMYRSIRNIPVKLCCVLLAAVMLLCGCDNGQPAEITETTEITDSGIAPINISGEVFQLGGKSAEAAELSDYPVIINNTTINEKPKTAICLSSSLTEIIYELGYGSRLIGRGSYCEYPEAVKALNDFGRPAAPDLDAVKNASPDVLITATAIPNIDSVALSDLGIKVVYIPSPHSLDEFGRIYKAIGMIFDGLFDGEENGNRVFSEIRSSLETSGISLGKFIYVTEGLSIAGGDTFENAVLSLFGTNIASGASGYIAYSELAADVQPDVVLLNSELGTDEISSDERLGALAAVQSGNIIKISNSCFESPTGQITELLEELSKAEETAQ